MADETPILEITPTVVISNSDVEIPASQSEILEVEAIEEIADSAVAIAEIEANKEITIAAIHADVETAAIEADKEKVEEWREEINRLTGMVEALMEQVNSLTLPLQPVVEAVMEELPIVEETDLIHPSTQAPTVETMMEPLEESVEEKLEEVTPNRVPKFIAI